MALCRDNVTKYPRPRPVVISIEQQFDDPRSVAADGPARIWGAQFALKFNWNIGEYSTGGRPAVVSETQKIFKGGKLLKPAEFERTSVIGPRISCHATPITRGCRYTATALSPG
jgi:hypothetical protein